MSRFFGQRRTDSSAFVARVTLVLGMFAICAVPAAAASSASLSGSAPPWAKSANYKAAADPAEPVGFRVYLHWNDPAAVTALAQAVSDPRSSNYRNYLTAAQFRNQFAPAQAQVNAVKSWLKSQGFAVEYTPQNNHYVSAEGTVAQVAAAFNVSMGMYAVRGLTLRSPSSDVSIPAELTGVVSGVVGPDDGAQLVTTYRTTGDAPPSPAFVSAQPCSLYWGQLPAVGFANPYGNGPLPYAPCGYTPQQVKGAYGLGSVAYDGSGQTVAIIDAYASPTIVEDVNQWSINRGLPPLTQKQFTEIVAPGTYNHPEKGMKQDPQGWYGEETLDIEAVHGMAPGANIVYVGAPNNFQDLDAALNHVVDKHIAQIVTNSYGFSGELLQPGFILPLEDTILQGVIEGIGIYFSSGDNGDESLVVGYATPDWPASSPFVTAVGGTTLAVGPSDNYLFETGWGTATSSWTGSAWSPRPPGDWLYGSGGGVSQLFTEPSYQQGVVPPSVFSAQNRPAGLFPMFPLLPTRMQGISSVKHRHSRMAQCSTRNIGLAGPASPLRCLPGSWHLRIRPRALRMDLLTLCFTETRVRSPMLLAPPPRLLWFERTTSTASMRLPDWRMSCAPQTRL